MSFEETAIASIHDAIDTALDGKRGVNMGAITANGKSIKITICAEPTLFSETMYANYPEEGKPRIVAGNLEVGEHTTTSVIEQLRSLEP